MRLYRPLSHVCTPSREHPHPCVYILTHARMLSYMHVETANFLTPLKCLSILVLCNRNNIVKIFNYIFYCPLNLLPLKRSTSLQSLQVSAAPLGPMVDDMEERTTNFVLPSHCTDPINSNCIFKILPCKPCFLMCLFSPTYYLKTLNTDPIK